MKKRKMLGCFKSVTLVLPMLLLGSLLAPTAHAATELTFTVNNSGTSREMWTALSEAYMKANPDVKLTVNFIPGGIEGDNVIKTSLATGTMSDVFLYNVGALLQAIDPVKNLVNLKNEPWVKTVNAAFFASASGVDGGMYAAPFGTAMGGGILYNKRVFSKLNLKIPLTWNQFMANNAKIKKAGIIPVVASFKDSWTAQLFVLADHFNVAAAIPGFDGKFTKNQIKVDGQAATLAGFMHLENVRKKGYFNKNAASTTFGKALEYLALGQAAQYPMLSAGIDTIVTNFPEKASDIGFYAQPGTNAKSNGITVWMPAGIYIPKTTKNLEAAKKFVAWTVSKESFVIQNKTIPPSGPYFIKGAPVSGTLTGVFTDLYNYMSEDGRSYPALEFVTPVKGPNLSQISVEVGLGQKTGKQGATAYQKDLMKQAQQLNLPGW
jgi:raffinose/stachyose/melibiose transport system substrate-binding protein